MKITAHTKTMNKKLVNIIAIVTALSLVFLQMPIFSYAQQARADAAAEVSAQAEETGSVDVGFSFDNAYITYDGQVIAPPASKVTLPLGADLEFAASADNGYEISSVVAELNGQETTLQSNGNGLYKISASALQDGAAQVSVKAVSVAAEVEDEAEVGTTESNDSDEPKESDDPDDSKDSDVDEAASVEESDVQSEFTYEDDSVTVVAKLTKPEALPEGAQFVVTRVTEKTKGYNYDAYMKALNKQAANGFQYTDENTLLFDVAFMVPKTDDNGEIIEGEYVEAQLEEGTVTIKVDFKKGQLTKDLNAKNDSDIEIKHLPLTDSKRSVVESTSAATDITVDDIVVEDVKKAKVESNEVSFNLDSLSLISATNAAGEEAAVQVSLLDGNGNVAEAPNLQGAYYLLCKVTKFYEPWNRDDDYYWCSDKLDLKNGETGSITLSDKSFKQAHQSSTTSFEGAKSVSFVLADAYPTADDQKVSLMNGGTPWINDRNASAYANGSTLEGYTVSISFSDSNGLQTEEVQTTDRDGLSTQAEEGTENGQEPPAPQTQPGEEAQNQASTSSSFVFKEGVSQSNTWEGTTVISASSIFGALAASGLDEFAVVAKNLITSGHLEGNVRVAQFSINGVNNSTPNLNEGQRMLAQNTVSSITIEKTIVGSGDGTFQFGFYIGTEPVKKDGKDENLKVSITTANGSGSITLTEADANGLFEKLNQGKQCIVYELDGEGNPVADGGTFGNYTVSYSYGETGSALATSNLDNFFGEIVTSDTNGVDPHFFRPSGLLNTNYFGQEPIERDGALYIGNNFRINNTSKSSEYIYIEGLKDIINSDVDSVSALSASLANAKNGDAGATHSDVNVINIKSTKGNLKEDLDAAGFFTGQDGNPGVIKGIVESGQPLLINIDLTGKNNYTINGQSVYYDGKNPQGDNGYSELGALVVYNFVTKDGPGYKPYAGNIKIGDWSAGLLLAPKASVDQTGAYWVGEIIANTVTHGGNEIHKKTTAKSRDKAITVAVQNEGEDQGKGSLKIKKNVTLNGASITSDEVDGTYEFSVRKQGNNQNTRTATITITNGQSNTAEVNNLEPGNYVVTELASSNPDGVQLVSDNGITVTVEANNSESIPVAEFTNNKMKGSTVFEGTKSLTGRNFKQGDEFIFTVTADEGTPMPENSTVTIKPTAGNQAHITFGEIAYTQADIGNTYTYTISEVVPEGAVNGKLNGVAYSAQAQTITVEVSSDNGALVVATSDNAKQLSFTNNFEATGTATLSGTKALVGRDFKQGDEFTFVVEAAPGTPMPKNDKGEAVSSVTIKPTGNEPYSFSFGEITYAQADIGNTYTYTISEVVPEDAVNGKLNGVAYTAPAQTVTVNVSDNGDGTLKVTYGEGESATEEAPTLQFTNSYEAEGSIELAGTKTLEGQKISAENAAGFTYEILDEQGEKVAEGTTNPDGDISYGEIKYYRNSERNDVGEHSYTVREIIPKDSVQVTEGKWAGKWKNGCYLYDGTNHTVVVNVSDGGNGILSANVVSVDEDTTKESADFTNAYEASGTVVLTATKQLTGRTLAAEEFSFELKDESGNVLQTVKNDEHGGIAFKIDYTLDDLTRNEDGTYAELTKTYTISEVVPADSEAATNPKAPGITYSEDVISVTVTVKDNGDGTLSAVPSYTDSNSMASSVITNSYEAEGSAEIKVTKEYDSWRDFNEFEFEITAAEGTPMPEKNTVKVTSSAKTAKFDPIIFKTSDLAGGEKVEGKLTKTFTYTVKEVAPAHEYNGITYDDAARTVTITATDNGDGTISTTQTVAKNGEEVNLTFKNTYDANGSITFLGEKTMAGRSLKDTDSFEFTITQVDELGNVLKVIPEKAKAKGASGKIEYPQITYTRADMLNADKQTYATSKTFYYTATEDVPPEATATIDGKTVEYKDASPEQKKAGGFTLNGVTYASTVKTFTVVVTDDGKGTLNAKTTTREDTSANANVNADADAEANAGTNANENTNANANANESANANANAITTAEADADADANAGGNANAGAGEGANADTGTDANAGADADEPAAASNHEPSKSSIGELGRTATNLNSYYDSTVRIKLQGEAAPVPPPEPEKPTYDLVFVVDTSQSQGDTATRLMNKMFDEAEKCGYNINIGIVKFYYVAQVTRYLDGSPGWDELSDKAGTNLPAGILLGTKLLDDDTSVANENKYLVVLSDGDTYVYQKGNKLNSYMKGNVLRTNGDDAMVVTQMDSDYLSVPFAGPGSYSWKYHNGGKEPEDFAAPAEGWDAFFSRVAPLVAADNGAYETKWAWKKNNQYPGVTNAIPEDKINEHACSADTSLYYSLINYRAASEKYNTYAACVEGGWNRPYGRSFMEYLNGGASFDVSKLEDALVEDLSSGVTQVEKGGVINDVIGYGYDDKGNAYDIDFVNDIETTDIILNGRLLAKTKNADGTFAFGQGKNGEPLFKLTYTGKAEPGTEGYTVKFSDEVLATDTVEMRYNVHLANPQTKAGTYGNYAEDGSPVDTVGLLVSSGGTFTRGDSSKAFANPVVSYSVLGFDNRYNATGSITLEGTKSMEIEEHTDDGTTTVNRDLTERDVFTFEVYEGETKVATGSNDTTGKITYQTINYTLDDLGEHTYTIREAIPDGAEQVTEGSWAGKYKSDCYYYDGTSHTVVVNVSDNGNGTLAANVVSVGGDKTKTSADFTNGYEAKGEAELLAVKTLEGRTLNPGEFTFELLEEGKTGPVATATNYGAGQVRFTKNDTDKFIYTLDDLGEHHYTIKEVKGNLAGVSYDKTTYSFTVTVEDNGDGTLNVTYDGYNPEEGVSFKNTYETHGKFDLSANKLLDGKVPAANAYEFQVLDKDGQVVKTAKNAADGTVTFENIPLDAPGTYEYSIVEKAPEGTRTLGGKEVDGNNVAYDTSVGSVTVEAVDNGNGGLDIDVAYDGGAPKVFENKTVANADFKINVEKAIDGREFKGGDKFTFTIEADDGAPMPKNKTVTIEPKSGKVATVDFGTITFTPDMYNEKETNKNTYRYRIKEVVPAENSADRIKGMIYDQDVHWVDVTLGVDSETGELTTTLEYEPPATTDNAGEEGVAEGAEGGAADGATATEPEEKITITNTAWRDSAKFKFNKHHFDEGDFTFKLTATDAEGNPREGETISYNATDEIFDTGTNAFEVTVANEDYKDGVAPIEFPEIGYLESGTYHYLVKENESTVEGVTSDTAKYLVHVTVNEEGAAKIKYDLLYMGKKYESVDDLDFYNNSKVTLGFASLSAQSYTDNAELVRVYPEVYKKLNDSTAELVGKDFTFTLSDTSGALIKTTTNDENGVVAFFDDNPVEGQEPDPGLVYDKPGTYTYIIHEVNDGQTGITYDETDIELVVTVTQDETGALSASTAYIAADGSGATKNTFENAKEGVDITVQKVSRSGGEGLEGSTYALYMVGENGDALIQEAVSDAKGYITFKDVNLIQGQKYYFKEVAAPSGHTVDPYRTAYFSLNEDGTALVLSEKTAADGWHSATEDTGGETSTSGAM